MDISQSDKVSRIETLMQKINRSLMCSELPRIKGQGLLTDRASSVLQMVVNLISSSLTICQYGPQIAQQNEKAQNQAMVALAGGSLCHGLPSDPACLWCDWSSSWAFRVPWEQSKETEDEVGAFTLIC